MNVVETTFRKEISWATLSRYLDEGGLSYQLTGTRTLKSTFSRDMYVKQYHNFLVTLNTNGFFYHSSDIACIDCCSNSRRLERVHTISLKGENK